MYHEEGIRSFWKGNGTNVARIAPFSAIQFVSFDIYRHAIIGELPPGTQPGFLKTLSAGAATGMTASTMCYPLDLVRSVLSVQGAHARYRGIIHAMKEIVKADGLLGLYRGLPATLMGIAPYVAINMSTFDLLKRRILLPSKDPHGALPQTTVSKIAAQLHPTIVHLSLGACAGFVSAAITYPTDLVRRRMQLQGSAGSGGSHDLPVYRNTWHCITETIRVEGVAAMYKGLVPCFLKVVPSMAIAFASYEFLRTHWDFDPTKVSKAPSAG